jgi:hypothetical protein
VILGTTRGVVTVLVESAAASQVESETSKDLAVCKVQIKTTYAGFFTAVALIHRAS